MNTTKSKLAQLSRSASNVSKTASNQTRKLNKKLTDLTYYHYYLPREEVETLLTKVGDFLIRESVMPDKRAAVILSLKTDNAYKHIPAEFNNDDGLFYFTENVGKPSILQLIEHHVGKKIPVRGVKLTTAIERTKWELLDAEVHFDEKVLGEGNFAVVRRGKLKTANGDEDVACKKLKVDQLKSKFDKDKAKFEILREFQVMRVIKGHKNILHVFGLYVGSEELAVVMEFCSGGSLEGYVEKHPSQSYEKISYLFHAACGLAHMHKLNLIHRDIASRNFLVSLRDPKLLPLIKVADFGLTRLGPTYTMKVEHKIPYIISAYECLDEKPYWTTKSDCWSFGVFIWHLFENCSHDPYYDHMHVTNGKQLFALLKEKYRLVPSKVMPAECKKIMAECFEADPEKRPLMLDIANRLKPILRGLYDKEMRK